MADDLTAVRMTIQFCSVLGCKNSTDVVPQMYKLPKDKKREKWLQKIGRPDLINKGYASHARVCAQHFDDDMLVGSGLRKQAFPNLNLPSPDDLKAAMTTNAPLSSEPIKRTYRNYAEKAKVNKKPPIKYANLAPKIQNIEEPSTSSESNEIKSEMDDVLELEKEIADMESSTNTLLMNIKTVSEKVPTRFDYIFKSLQSEMEAKYRGDMYQKMFRLHCMNMYCKAPKVYPVLKRTFQLPSVKTLQNTKTILPPGINTNFLKLVAKILNTPKSKHVMVRVDEIALKKRLYYDIRQDDIIGYQDVNGKRCYDVADSAIIISIQGVFVNFKQIVAYNNFVRRSFKPFDVSVMIDTVIRAVTSAGFYVHAVLCKHSQHMELLALFKCNFSLDDPCFVLDKKEIFFMFDIPQLLNEIRNSLIDFDFQYSSRISAMAVSWDHMKLFYQTEMDRRMRLAPKITDIHLEPKGEQTTKEQLARDVFSPTVVAAMSADIDSGLLPNEALGTVDFFAKMNDLINICSATKIKHPNKYKRVYTGAKYQVEAMDDIILTLRNMQIIDKVTRREVPKDQVSCVKGMVVSMTSITQIYKTVQQLGLNYLPAGRFIMKSKELMSDLQQLRDRSRKKNDLFTAIELRRSFSALALKQVIENATLSSHRPNLDELILADESSNIFVHLQEYIPRAPRSSPLAIGATDYRIELPSTDSFKYVCSYLLKKCAAEHSCAIFTEYLYKNETAMHLRKGSLLHEFKDFARPPKDFVSFMILCDRIVLTDFEGMSLRPQPGLTLFKALKAKGDFKPCPCFPVDYLIKLFLRMRFYNNIKYRNRGLKLGASLSKILKKRNNTKNGFY